MPFLGEDSGRIFIDSCLYITGKNESYIHSLFKINLTTYMQIAIQWLWWSEVKWSEVAQSCPTLCDPVDCSLPGSSVHGILQARVLEWGAITFSGYKFEVKWSEVAQSCPTLCNPMECSLPGSSIHGIFQARILEWVAISFSRGSSRPRDQSQVSHIVGRRFTIWATREALDISLDIINNQSVPGGTSGKQPSCQCRRRKRCRFTPCVRKIPWRRA